MTRRFCSGLACWVKAILTIGALWLLWPAWLGGSTSLVVVSGTSMLPTYESGDLLLVREGRAEVGDVIVFEVPRRSGQIVHRVIERRSDGTLLVQGDNRNTPDLPLPRDADVVGVALGVIPHGTLLVRLATSPLVLGVGAGCWVFARRLHAQLDAAAA